MFNFTLELTLLLDDTIHIRHLPLEGGSELLDLFLQIQDPHVLVGDFLVHQLDLVEEGIASLSSLVLLWAIYILAHKQIDLMLLLIYVILQLALLVFKHLTVELLKLVFVDLARKVSHRVLVPLDLRL